MLASDGPFPASTVIVLRERPLEVLLVRRHERSAFLAGAYVFPGGRVEPVDDETAAPLRAAAVRELHEETGVRVPPESLVLWARWLTPEGEPRRFDAHFFAAPLPGGETAAHDGTETTDSVWTTPAEAIRRAMAGDIYVAPPTWTSLVELLPFESIDDALTSARSRPIVRREPRIVTSGGQQVLILPGSPGFRFVFVDGRWRPGDGRT